MTTPAPTPSPLRAETRAEAAADSANPYASPSELTHAKPPEIDSLSESQRKLALRSLRIPAWGSLLVASLTTWLWFFGILLVLSDDTPSLYREPTILSNVVTTFYPVIWGYLAFHFFIAFIAALAMLSGRYHRLSQTAQVLSLIPLYSPLFPLSLPFGIWSLRSLAKPQTRQAFALVAKNEIPARHQALKRLFWPAAMLLFFALGEAMIAMLGLVVQLLPQLVNERQGPIKITYESAMVFIMAGFGLLIVTLAAIQMLRGRTRLICLIGAGIAILPIFTPGVFFGIPFGAWALLILLRKDVRTAFAEAK